MTDTKALNDLIKLRGKKKIYLSDMLDISKQSFSNKLSNRTEWKAGEINLLCAELGITSMATMRAIFFADHVDGQATR